MQSETADLFIPSAADNCWIGRLIRAYSLHYMEHDVIHKTGSIALPSEDRATATDNMYRKFGTIWTCLRYASG